MSEKLATNVRKMDSYAHVDELQAIGRAAAADVAEEHFVGFEL